MTDFDFVSFDDLRGDDLAYNPWDAIDERLDDDSDESDS